MKSVADQKRRQGRPSTRSESEFSLTASRALQVLTAFSADRPELGVSELSRALSLSKPAVQRLVHALEMNLFLDQNPETRKYRIGVQAYYIGRLFAYSRLLEGPAQAVIQNLVADTGYTCYLALLRHDQMIIVATVEGSGPIRYSMPVGTRLAAHNTATGKAGLSRLPKPELDALIERNKRAIDNVVELRAELASIRARGFSTIWGEAIPGVGAVSAPITDAAGHLIAVLCLGFAIGQVTKRDVPQLGNKIVKAAREMGKHFAANSAALRFPPADRGLMWD